jgi:hypothetical protein
MGLLPEEVIFSADMEPVDDTGQINLPFDLFSPGSVSHPCLPWFKA